jgi:hypothetical protein
VGFAANGLLEAILATTGTVKFGFPSSGFRSREGLRSFFLITVSVIAELAFVSLILGARMIDIRFVKGVPQGKRPQWVAVSTMIFS